MAKGARRGGRVRDKWRDKQWLILDSPNSFGDFGGHHINYLPITDTSTAIGRVVENTLFDIKKQDPADHKTKVFVEIENVNEGVASTIFKGHEYGKEFLRSLVRRGSSMITHIHNYTTQDGNEFRVEIIAFSQRRINSSKKHELRRVIHNLLSDKIPQWDLNTFIKQVTDDNSEFNREILENGKKISSLRHIGIKKTKLVSSLKSPVERSNVDQSENESQDEIESNNSSVERSNVDQENKSENESQNEIAINETESNTEPVEDIQKTE